MYCSHCGNEISDKAAVCVRCGVAVGKRPQAEGQVSSGWWWLGFFIPLAGLLIWIFTNDTEPVKAKRAGLGALVGVITSVALAVMLYAFAFGFMFTALTFY